MKDKIIEISKELNIDLIGFTSVDVFSEVKHAIEIRKGEGDISPFFSLDIEKNTNPLQVWDEAQSIISIGISYKYDLPIGANKSNCGKISRVAWGRDYHIVLMDKMDSLIKAVQKYYPLLEYKAFTDTGFLLDRAIAERSGLGFYGKNGFIIHPLYGSYIFLGHILINHNIKEKEQSISSRCGLCRRCIKCCPTGALGEGQVFHSKKCISYLTQKKEFLTRIERKSIGNHLYGCDVCQEVCPINKEALPSNEKQFYPDSYYVRPSLKEIIEMDNRTFKNVFGSTSAGWRGKKNLQRNAIIVAGNIKGVENLQLLKNTLKDQRWDIRLYAMLSLLEYGDIGKELLEKSLELEDEEFKKKFNIAKA